MPRNKIKALCLLMAFSGSYALNAIAAPKPAQSWKVISSATQGERIELDVRRIGRMPNGNTAAWSRLFLGFDIPDANTGVRYNTIEALNSYDCSKREYSTLKRIYIGSDGKPVREEKVASPRNIEIIAGSFEEKLLPHVCKPRSVGEMQGIADLISQLATPPTPGVMPADMRSEGGQKAAAAVKVADTEKAAAAPIMPPSRPRMIELPKIDKSKIEDPYAGKPPPAKPSSTTSTEPSEAKPVQNKVAPAKAAPEAAKPTEAPVYHTGAVSRAEIERQLATFGPRKPKARKPAAKVIEEESEHVHWSYAGKGGPEHWAKIDAANHSCASGKRQSPIDIHEGIKVDLEPIKFNYGQASFSIIDNGHTVQVNVAQGHSIRIMERSYELLQFHFHKPAEERVNGRSYDMVAHFVHKDSDGNVAVIAVLMDKGGPEHPELQTLWNNLPLETGMVVSPSTRIDLNKLLPENRTYWTYMGSLTTPPCTEGVMWMVMKQTLTITAEQIGIFSRLYPNNARPIQPANGRLIKESR